MPTDSPTLLRISPADNVLVAVRTLEPGTLLEIDGRVIPLGTRVGLGHKLAARDIAAGGKIIKYGVSIGSATVAIQAGDLVHLHNMKSDYLPTYLRGEELASFHEH
jgi:hypothetical protein